MFLKVLKISVKVVLVLLALFVFVFYLKFLLKPYYLKLGYTLNAAIGEDFFAVYQASYNFFHNIFIYGEPAQTILVTPYFMVFKYFPVTPLLIGWPFLLFSAKAELAYYSYLIFVLLFYIIGFYAVYLITKKFQADSLTKTSIFFLWFTFFPILSDLRMGQFNLIASLFFLFSLVSLAYSRQILNAFNWIISLVFKPIALLNIFYYFKTRNKTALTLFILFFVIFTLAYLGYYSLYYPEAFSDFFTIIFLSGNRTGWQIHYPDNFSINSFLGELFYDKSKIIFSLISKLYIFCLFLVFLIISLKLKFKKDIKTELYYSLYAFTTMVMYHKEVWESWLSIWIVVITLLLILTDNKKEKIFLFLNGLILGTPSLFYFYELNHSNFWRFLLIFEKTIPQILIYSYLIYQICIIIRQDLQLRTNL
ncbi:MAG: glycosyltransferase 87 family protein [Minisyncoccia bacterium]